MFRKKGNSNAQVQYAQASDLAIVFDDARQEIVVASIVSSPAESWRTEKMRFPKVDKVPLAQRIEGWRLSLGVNADSFLSYLLVPSSFSERTRVLALPQEVRNYETDALISYLVSVADRGIGGEDGHPLFESSLNDIACDITFLPDGNVALTETLRSEVDESARRLYDTTKAEKVLATAAHDEEPALALGVETKVRTVARACFAHFQSSMNLTQTFVSAIVVINSNGAAIGLWSPLRGLFVESGEYFENNSVEMPEDEFDDYGINIPILSDADTSAFDESMREGLLESIEYIVAEKLSMYLSPAWLAERGINGVGQIIWAASSDVKDDVRLKIESFASKNSYVQMEMPEPLEETVAEGLLIGYLGTDTVSSDFQKDAVREFPVINLASDLRSRVEENDAAAFSIRQAQQSSLRRKAVAALTIPFAVMLAFLIAFWIDAKRVEMSIAYQQVIEDKEAARLRPIAESRKSAEENFKWFQEYISQIIELRKRQSAAIGLYANLDSRYPISEDSTFYVSELKAGANGVIEIKGLTKSEEAVIAFTRSLELGGTDEKGNKLFTNIAYEVKRGIAQPAGGNVPIPQIPQMQSTLGSQQLAPDVIAWSVRGTYTPLASAQNVKKSTPTQNTQPGGAK